MKRKILIAIPTLGLGGAEEIIVRLCNNLASTHTVDLMLLQRCNEDNERIAALDPRVRVNSFFSKTSKTRSLEFSIKNLILWTLFLPISILLLVRYRLWQYDVVHINLTKMALYSVFWNTCFSILPKRPRLIQTFHTNLHLLPQWARTIFKLSWRHCDEIIVEIDENEVSRVKLASGRNDIKYIPFAVPFQSDSPKKIDANHTLRLGTLARLRFFEKKYDIIIDALHQLKKTGLLFEYHIGGDGPDREKIEQLVFEKGLSSSVIFHGFVGEPSNFLESIDLLVVATVGEETGIAGLQALSKGIPLVGINTMPGWSTKCESPMLVGLDATDLAKKILHASARLTNGEYARELMQYKKDYIDDRLMMSRYKKIFSDRLRVDLVFMADHGRPVGKGLEVQALINELYTRGLIGRVWLRSSTFLGEKHIKSVLPLSVWFFRILSLIQKKVNPSFRARLYQEILFDFLCSLRFKLCGSLTGRLVYMVPRLPKTAAVAKRRGAYVVLHAAEMSPAFNRNVLSHLYGNPENWPTIWSLDGLNLATDMLSHLDGVIAHTQACAISYKNSGIKASKIRVIPMGFDPESFPAPINKNRHIGKKIRFLYVGNMTRMKGLDTLLQAWESVTSDLVELHLCGTAYEDILDLLTTSTHRFSNIFIHGWTDPSPHMATCDVFVFPSRSESFGKVMVEAGAMGMAIICNKAVLLDEDFVTKGRGICFDDSVESLCQAMLLLINDRNLLIRLGIEASNHFRQLTWKNFGKGSVDAIQAIYTEMRN